MKVPFRFWLLGIAALSATACSPLAPYSNALPNPQNNVAQAVKSSATASLAQAQSDPFAQTQVQPNFQLNVQRQAGTCPNTVGLWMFMLGYEGGADHTVVADTQAIASAPAKLIVSQAKRLEYEAPLRKEYASCVGQASSPLVSAYNFQFRNGKVNFRMDVSRDDGYRAILYKGVSASRPYIHWRANE